MPRPPSPSWRRTAPDGLRSAPPRPASAPGRPQGTLAFLAAVALVALLAASAPLPALASSHPDEAPADGSPSPEEGSGSPSPAAPGGPDEGSTFLLSVVGPHDGDHGLLLPGSLRVAVGFIDGDADGAVDAIEPDEPVYLDLDRSGKVSYGDIRLTGFMRYDSGSRVGITNRDLGRPLAPLPGWFAQNGTTWYLDGGQDGKVDAGDVRMGPEGRKVEPSDDDLGRSLTPIAGPHGTLFRPAEGGGTFYVDGEFLSQQRQASAGDLRLQPGPIAPDVEAWPPPETVTVTRTAQPEAPLAADAAAVAALPWRTLDWVLMLVGLANLAGLVVLVRATAPQRPRPPPG